MAQCNSHLGLIRLRINPGALLSSTFLFAHLALVSNAYASPEGGQVVGGVGSINQSGINTTINQATQNMAIDWKSYNVQQNERVQYIQPNSSSISLNRIIGNNASTIHGKIDANGQVILVNPNGIFFSATSSINVGGLMASGLDIKPSDFMNGNYIFNEVAGTNGTVYNSGIINAATGGNVTLLGKQVKNGGMIIAKLGAVNMAAGKQAVVTFDNVGLLGVRITKEILQNELGIDPAVLNNGSINAEGGRILLTASVSQDIFSRAVNTGDMVDSTSVVVNEDGTFTLGAGADVVNNGTLDVSTSEVNTQSGGIVVVGNNVTSSGVIKAGSSSGNGGNIELHATNTTLLTENSITSARAEVSGIGGNIKVLGNKVGLFDQALVDASGANGGGEVLIGGDRTGKNKQIRNADFIYLGENIEVKADALDNGNGGKLITFAGDTAKIYGKLSARGGVNGGNGGFIETSGLRGFEITTTPDISAPMGLGGEWLIDPYNIRIVPNGNTNNPPNINNSSAFVSTGDATLDVDLITTALSNGNVTITTGTGGVEANGDVGNITFGTSLLYNNSNNSSKLTLNAANDIIINAREIRADQDSQVRPRPSKTLALVLNANADGVGGGDVNLTNSQISTNGGDFTATGVNFISSGGEINTVRNNYNIGGGGTNNGTKGGTVNITVTGMADTVTAPVTHPSSIVIGGNILTDGGGVSLVANLGGSSAGGGTISTTASIDTTTQPFINNVSGGNDRDSAATNTGTVSMTADAGINLGASILTDGKKIEVISATSFTSDVNGILGTSGGSNGSVAINSTGLITSGGQITTNNGTVDITSTGPTAALAAVAINNSINTNGANVTIDGGNLSNTGAINTTGGSGGVAMTSTGTINSNGQITTGSGNVDLVSTGSGVASNITIGTGITTGSGGNLNIKNNGVINAALAPLVIGGATTINNTGANVGINAITLTGANDFQNTVQITNTSGAVNITDINNINFASSNIGVGAFTVTAGGNISQSGSGNGFTQVADASTRASFTSTSGGSIILDNGGNDFTNTVSLNNSTGSGNVSIKDANNIDFATSNLGSGTFTVSAKGITQTGGAITQAVGGAGSASFRAVDVITLGNTSNDFTGKVALNNGGAFDVVLADVNGISLTQSSVGKNLTVTAGTGGDIIQDTLTPNDITVIGNASFNVDGGRSIILGDTNNQFNGLAFNAKPNTGTTLKNVTVANASGLDLQTLNLTGDLNVTAVGAITNTTGSMIVAGTTTLNAGSGNNITLATGANNFNEVVIVAGNDVSLTDINGINIGDTVGTASNISGDLTLSANGNITQTAALTMAANKTASFNAGVGGINLSTHRDTNAALNNDFKNVVLNAAGNVAIADINAITIGDAVNTVSNIGGNLTVNANGAINQTAAITMNNGTTASFSAGTGAINLGTQANDFDTLQLASSNVVSINDVAGGLDLGTTNITGTGTLSVVATGAITNTAGNIVVAGLTSLDAGNNSISLATGTHDFSRVNVTNATNLAIADVNALTLGGMNFGGSGTTLNVTTGGALSQAAGTSITSNGNTIINAGANSIALDNANNDFVGSVSLNNSGANDAVISDSNNILLAKSTIGRNLNVTAGTGSDIIQDNSAGNGLTVGGTATFNVDGGRSILLGNTSNNIAGLSFLAKPGTGTTLQNVTVANASGLDLQTLNLTGNLDVTAAGAITNSAGSMTVAGVTKLNAGSGNNITLATGANNFNEVVIVAGNDVSLTDINGLNIGDAAGTASNISGDLTLSANGNITQTAALTMAANTTATFNAGAGAINLSTHRDTSASLNNDFKNVVLNATGSVAIADINTITIGDAANTVSNIGGNFTVNANGAINQTAAITMNAGTTASFSAGSGAINLAAQANDFDTLQLASSNAVSINDVAGGLDLSTTNITGAGTLSVVATGAITNSAGNIVVAGLTSLDAGNNSISLATGTHDFSRVNVANTTNLTINDVNALTLGGMNLGGSGTTLNVTTGGALSQAAGTSITSNGNTIVNAGANSIALDNANNDFVGSVSLNNSVGNVSITDVNDFDFTTSNLGSGSLTVNAVGITQTGGAITQSAGAGQASFNAGAGVITLDNSGNEFTGNVALNNSGANDVVLNDNSSISLAQSSVGQNLTITAGLSGDITQLNTGNGLTVSGTSTFNVDGGHSITLGNIRNNFNGLAFNAKPGTGTALQDVTVANASGLDLQTLDLTGNLDVTAAGAITNSAGSMTVTGTTTLNAGSGNNITLTTGANNFNEVVIVAGNDVSLTDINGLNIGDAAGTASNISGDLVVTTNGNVTQTSGLTMLAGTTATVNAGVGSINLSTHRDTNAVLNNDFKNVVLNAAGNVAIADTNTITIGDAANTASNIGGNFTVNANGAINQTAAITMNAGTTASFSAGTGAINLGTQANNFDTIQLSSSNAVSINDVAGGLDLGTTNITGNGTLSVVTNGAITNNAGNIVVSGLTSLDAGNNSINLSAGTHDFSNVVFTGSNVTLADSTGINIGGNNTASSTTGSLTIFANGNITDNNSSSVVVANATIINAGSGDIALANADFQGTLTASAGSAITVNNASSLNVTTVSAVSLVDLTSGGAINSSGSIASSRVNLQAVNGINVTTQTSTLKADNIGGAVKVNNTGNLILESLTTSGDIDLNNDLNISMKPGSVDADFDTGNIIMTTTRGSFLGLDAPDINNADVTAFTAQFIGRNGSFGSVVRPIVLNVKESVFINTRRSVTPRLTAPGPRLGVTDLSDFQFDFGEASNAIAGEQLISLEELEDIDPAIFSDVRNYTYGQVAIRLPRDQLFEDELNTVGDK